MLNERSNGTDDLLFDYWDYLGESKRKMLDRGWREFFATDPSELRAIYFKPIFIGLGSLLALPLR